MMRYLIALLLTLPLLLAAGPLQSSQKIRRVGEWETPPTVVLCDTETVSKENLKLILRWWEELGYEFGQTVVSPTHRGCSGNVGGTITITRTGLGANTLFLEREEKLRWAKVKLPRNTPNLILAHEIGHALGWTHTRSSNHIMNGRYSEAGWFSGGLQIGSPRAFPGARGPRRGGSAAGRGR